MKFLNLIIHDNKKNIIFIISFFAFITIILIAGNLNLIIDNDVTILLPVNYETEFEREKIKVLEKEFPASQLLFVGIKNNPFKEDKIKKLWEMCRELNSLKVVKSSLNPFNAVYFEKFHNTFKMNSYSMRRYPETQEDIDKFVENLYTNRYLVGTVLSYDKQTAGIVLSMNYNATMGEEIKNKSILMKMQEFLFNKKYGLKKIDRLYFCQQVEKVLKKYNSTFEIFYAGVPVYEAKTKEYMNKDIFLLIIPVMIMMILIFYLNFRSFRGILLPVLTILLSLSWTMGLIAWLRFKINIIGILIPPLIMTVGSSYTLQFLNSYYHNCSLFDNPKDVLINTAKSISSTILLAALTTIAGFFSFITVKIKPIREFGVFVSISILFTLLITFFLTSNLLILFPKPKPEKFKDISNDFFSKVLDKIKNIIYPTRFVWLFVYAASIILFIFFIPQLKIETNPANYFKKNDNVKRSLVYLQKNFGGTNHYNITIRSIENKRNFFKTKEGLFAAKKIQDYLDKQVTVDGYEMIGWYVSPVTLIEDLNKIVNGKRDIPEDEQMIKRFFTYIKLSNSEWTNAIINHDFSAITFQVRTNTTNIKNDYIMTEQELSKLTKILNDDLEKIRQEDGRFTVTLWGELFLLSKISKFLINDQIWSLTATIILVLLICLIYFRSIYFSIISVIPLSFGVMMSFTVMAIFKIPLDIATVMIAAISIGIGVDNTIQFLINYRRNLKIQLSCRESLMNTFTFTSRPILFTSLALIMGFSVFFLSSFKPIIFFGMLIALSMVTCTFATLFILPSFLIITDKIRIFFHKKNS